MKQQERMVKSLIEFGNSILKGLKSKDRNEIIPAIEDTINLEMDKLDPQELGMLGAACLLLISKVAMQDATTETDEIKAGVVCSRAVINAVNKASEQFGMTSFDVAYQMLYEPLFTPAPISAETDLLTKALEDIDCVGEC